MRRLRSDLNPALAGWGLPDGVPGPNAWYRLWRMLFRMAANVTWQVRVVNRHHEPTRGPALYLCNHQSYLDPGLMSVALQRPMNFMAREGLFGIPGFGRFIASLLAFPVRRGAADTGAMKEALRRLKRGGQLVVFPEGTRTPDGRVGPFLPGVALLARRAAEWVVPVLIDGAFELWPRHKALPRLGQIFVAYCPPLGIDAIHRLGDAGVLAVARERIIAMQTEIRRRFGKAPYEYPSEVGNP